MRFLDVNLPSPRDYLLPMNVVSWQGGLYELGEFVGGTWNSGAWPTANLAIFVPLEVYTPRVITQLATVNGTAVSGNIDVGIYDLAGNRLVSAGSTAQAGTSTVQVFNVTDIALKPGVYMLALALDNTTGTITRSSTITTQMLRVAGVQQMASAFPLPSLATYATPSNAYAPVFGASVRGTL